APPALSMVEPHRHTLGGGRYRGPAIGYGRRILRSGARLSPPPAPLGGAALGGTCVRLSADRLAFRRPLGLEFGFAGDRIGSAALLQKGIPMNHWLLK